MMGEMLVIAGLVALLALLWVPRDSHDDDDDDGPGGLRRARVRVTAAPRRQGKGK